MQIPGTLLNALRKTVGAENILTDEASLLLHGYDCSLSRARPDAVVFVPSADKIAPLIKLLADYKIPFVARASATNHAGSCAPLRGGIILNLTKLNRILQICTEHAYAWVEPGVITADLQRTLAPLGFFYAPDPASERICTLGGNFAQNASGARCLKYGGTLDHILAAEVVLPTGETLALSRQDFGPDLIGLLTGSEGTLGIITKIQVKILPLAAHIQTFLVSFSSLEACVQAVSDLAAHGIIPRCVEAMDQATIQAIENFSQAGYPTQAGALLILELDGTPEQIEQDRTRLETICQQHNALSFTHAQKEDQREKLWLGRRVAYAAMAQIAPNVMVGDGTVPRSELPRALKKVREILQENNLQAGLLFHAGDGNFHPHLIFNGRNRPETQQTALVLRKILQACVDCGGTISGEHGVGVEKRALMAYQYDVNTLTLFTKIKQAADPDNLANPLKIIPLDYREKAHAAEQPPQAVAAQLAAFVENKTPFVITGNNTRLHTDRQAVLSSHTLTEILEIDLQNYTATAQAGISLHALHEALAAKNVFSALPAEDGTLGGAFSSGQFPGFYAYVTGLAALLPDGSLVRYGGKLTKNAAGYNAIRLFAGAQGMFGLVTELTFKIFAAPQPVLEARPFQPARHNLWTQRLSAQLDALHLLEQESLP